jgi:hypothetical protein
MQRIRDLWFAVEVWSGVRCVDCGRRFCRHCPMSAYDD